MSMRAGNIPRESTSVIAAEKILSIVAPALRAERVHCVQSCDCDFIAAVAATIMFLNHEGSNRSALMMSPILARASLDSGDVTSRYLLQRSSPSHDPLLVLDEFWDMGNMLIEGRNCG